MVRLKAVSSGRYMTSCCVYLVTSHDRLSVPAIFVKQTKENITRKRILSLIHYTLD